MSNLEYNCQKDPETVETAIQMKKCAMLNKRSLASLHNVWKIVTPTKRLPIRDNKTQKKCLNWGSNYNQNMVSHVMKSYEKLLYFICVQQYSYIILFFCSVVIFYINWNLKWKTRNRHIWPKWNIWHITNKTFKQSSTSHEALRKKS